MAPIVRMTTYEVLPSVYAELGVNQDIFSITVELTDPEANRWAVRSRGRRLSRARDWDYEPLPSSRTPEWKVEHQFDHDEALELATELIDKLVVNGRTPAEVVEWMKQFEER